MSLFNNSFPKKGRFACKLGGSAPTLAEVFQHLSDNVVEATGALRHVAGLAMDEEKLVVRNAEVIGPLVAKVCAAQPIPVSVELVLRDAKSAVRWENGVAFLRFSFFRRSGVQRWLGTQAHPHEVDILGKCGAKLEGTSAEEVLILRGSEGYGVGVVVADPFARRAASVPGVRVSRTNTEQLLDRKLARRPAKPAKRFRWIVRKLPAAAVWHHRDGLAQQAQEDGFWTGGPSSPNTRASRQSSNASVSSSSLLGMTSAERSSSGTA